MMHYVYILKSEIKSFVYVGNCSDLRRRFADHNAKRVQSTKFYAPFKLVYYESYADKKDALNREYKLKHHGSAIAKLKERLKYSFGYLMQSQECLIQPLHARAGLK